MAISLRLLYQSDGHSPEIINKIPRLIMDYKTKNILLHVILLLILYFITLNSKSGFKMVNKIEKDIVFFLGSCYFC